MSQDHCRMHQVFRDIPQAPPTGTEGGGAAATAAGGRRPDAAGGGAPTAVPAGGAPTTVPAGGAPTDGTAGGLGTSVGAGFGKGLRPPRSGAGLSLLNGIWSGRKRPVMRCRLT